MQNAIEKFRQSPIVFERPVFYTFINNSTSKPNKKKISCTLLKTLLSRKRVQSFSKKH